MIELPAYITVTEFEDYLASIYPPQNIYVYDSTGDIDIIATEILEEQLLFSAYTELDLAYNMSAAPQATSISATFMHSTHIWRSEGSRSAREDLIAQGVTEAGVVKEKYDQGILPFSPIIRSLLEPYTRTVAMVIEQKYREMNY